MERRKRLRSKRLDDLKRMPALYHKMPNQDFDIEKSEVLKWLGAQKELLDWLRGYAKDAGYIKYDQETGKWSGTEQEEQE
ncbi:hypothetical protein [Candidatus Enterococcus ikei]|uniref:Uncharacterized protein n=1 Tax=Candidatus Enterococcus ikei TaxID=2815326 RepID=A0ABS3GVU6_9ENTE|nr:hypothetical protein [Enterococcus sp. DIV0869a]MBO0438950.1 hypothetical protein [Enterococcus sp. DIV0869a]